MFPYFGFALRQREIPHRPTSASEAVEITLAQAELLPARSAATLGRTSPYVSLHAHQLSPSCEALPSFEYLQQLRSLALDQGVTSVAQYLGGIRELPAIDGTRSFLPPAWTEDALDQATRNLHFVQTFCEPLHFYVESVAYLFRQASEMNEAEFLSRLLTRTGCGWLLNLTHLHANATNFRFDAYEFLAEVLPAAQRVQIHLTGGQLDDGAGMFIPSSEHAVPEAVWDLYRFAMNQGRGRIEAVFVGRDPAATSGDELAQARHLAEETLRVRKPRIARVG